MLMPRVPCAGLAVLRGPAREDTLGLGAFGLEFRASRRAAAVFSL